MKTFRNLIILGTSHIAIESVNEVKEIIEREKPELIALELDLLRFKKLISRKRQKIKLKDIFSNGSLLNTIGAFVEKKLGEKVGIMPGEEMLTAIKLAKKNKIEIALIDQPIQITFQRLSKEITFKEKMRFVTDILTSLVIPKKRIKIDLTKVPEKKLIKKMIREVKMHYPNVYKTLIKERNLYMAKQLSILVRTRKKTLAIMGAGHEDDIWRLLNAAFKKRTK